MGDTFMGCTMEEREPKMAGGVGGGRRRPKTGGNQNDGGAVGQGTHLWVAPWNMGDSEWGGDPQ